MASMKRPASSGAFGGKSPKRSSRDPIGRKCHMVAEAILDSEELPEKVRTMLAEMIPSSLSVSPDERHAFQNKTVEMVEEALAGIEQTMQLAVAEGQVKVDNSDAVKAQLVAAVDQAQSTVTDRNQKSMDAREASENDAAAVKEAKHGVAEAHTSQVNTEKELEEKVGHHARLMASAETFGGFKGNPIAQTKEGHKSFADVEGSLLNLCGCEPSMVGALHMALKKDVASRGSFDVLVVEQATATFSKVAAELAQALAASENTKAAALTATASAEAACAAATQKSTASHAAFDAAVSTMREAEEGLRGAKEAVENFEENTAEAASNLEEAKEYLADFLEGPRAAFSELKTPPPALEPLVPAAAEAA